MNQSQESIITTVAALFAVVAIGFGLSFGGTQLIHSVAETAQQQNNNVANQPIAQTANAQDSCPTYATSIGGSCVRSGSTTYTVVLASSTPNSCPTDSDIKDDSYSTGYETSKTVSDPGVLGNDSDPDGDSLDASLVSGPSDGYLYGPGGDGSFQYNPGGGFSGEDSFTYEAQDVTGDSSCSAMATATITVLGPGEPIPVCEITPPDPTTGDSLTFDASSSTDPNGSIIQYAWSIYAPDGDRFPRSGATTTLSGSNVDTSGEYWAELAVTDNDGNYSTTTCSVDVSPTGGSVDVTLTADGSNQTTINEGDSVDLEVSSSNVTDGCTWQNGLSGSAPENDTETVSPPASGSPHTYEVECAGSDGNDSDTATVTVLQAAPTADFSYSPAGPQTGDDVTFESQSSDPDGSIESWDWTFEGVSNGLGSPITRSWSSRGSKDVTLQVTDDDDLTDQITKSVGVSAPPKAKIGPLTNSILIGQFLTLDGTGSYDQDSLGNSPQIVSHDWSTDPITSIFDPNKTSPTTKVAFINSGTYIVELEIEDNEGETADAQETVDATLPSFSLDPPQQDMWVTAESDLESTQAAIKVDPGPGFSLSDFSQSNFSIINQANINNQDISMDYNSEVLTLTAQDDESSNDPIGFERGSYDIVIEATATYNAPSTPVTHTVTETATTTLRAQTVSEF